MYGLSIASAALAIVGTIANLSKEIGRFLATASDARADQEAVQEELTSLSSCLQALHDVVEGLRLSDTMLKLAKVILKEIDQKLEQIQALLRRQSAHKLGKRLHWAWSGQQDMWELRKNLEAHKSAIQIVLQAGQISMQYDQKQITSDIFDIVNDLRQDQVQSQELRAQNELLKQQLADLQHGGTQEIALQRFLEASTTYAESLIDDDETVADGTWTPTTKTVSEPELDNVHGFKHMRIAKQPHGNPSEDPPEQRRRRIALKDEELRDLTNIKLHRCEYPGYAVCAGEQNPPATTYLGAFWSALEVSRNAFLGSPYPKAMLRASWQGDVRAVRELLANGVCPNISYGGDCALACASIKGHALLTRILLKAGADPDNQGSGVRERNTPLHHACTSGHAEIAKLLIAAGADPDTRADEGVTPLMAAVRHQFPRLVEILLSYGADVDARNVGGETALLIATAMSQVDVVRLLAAAGADVTVVARDGLSVLGSACVGDVRILELLLDAGKADANSKVEEGATLLELACADNSLEKMELLFRHGATLSACKAGGTKMFTQACREKQVDVVKLLIAHGVPYHYSRIKEMIVEEESHTRGQSRRYSQILKLLKGPDDTKSSKEESRNAYSKFRLLPGD